MTLQKFSDKSFSSMFKTRLKSAVFFPIVGMIILGIMAVAQPFDDVVKLNNPTMYGNSYGYWGEISIENVRYILFGTLGPADDSFPDNAIIMYFTVIIAAILCAIMVFKDLSNKKTANVYYSLGFSRTKLFASTYLAGISSVIGMIIIPFALSFVINAFAFGVSKELISACIFTVSCLCNVSLIAYTLSAIAMTLSGMLVEGVFFSFFLNAISPIFSFASCMFSDGLLTGGGFVAAEDFYYGFAANSFMSAFLGKLSFMNGLSHSASEVNRLGCCLYTADGFSEIKGFVCAESWTTPNFIPLLVWSFILAGLIALSVYVFNHKKAENIGFFASSPILYRIFFGTLIVGFSSLGCSSGRTITKGLTWLYILIILAICLVITTILTLILVKLSRMKFKKEFKIFGIYSLAVVLFAFVFSTGFFGYQNRLPAVEKVAEVEITGFASMKDSYNYSEIYGNSHYYDPGIMPISIGSLSYGYENYSFSSKADITHIQELHKSLIDADNIKLNSDYKETKIGAKINIVYTLKNGKTLSRSYYSITPAIIEQYLAYKGNAKEIKSGLVEDLYYMIASMDDGEDFYSDYIFKEFVTVFSNDMTNAHNVDLSQEELMEGLFPAYQMDVENLSVQQLLRPKEKALGLIAIRNDYNVSHAYDEMTGEPIIEGMGSELEYRSLTNNNVNFYDGCGFIVINENMTNTIKWAKDAGIYKYFANDYKIPIASVEATHNNSSFIKLALAGNHNYNLIFSSRTYQAGDSYAQDNFSDTVTRLAGSHYVMNLTEDEIKFLRENAHPYFLTTETGYFLRFATGENPQLFATVFVPDSKLTPELKIKLAQNNDSEVGYEKGVTAVGTVPSQYNMTTEHYIPAQ